VTGGGVTGGAAPGIQPARIILTTTTTVINGMKIFLTLSSFLLVLFYWFYLNKKILPHLLPPSEQDSCSRSIEYKYKGNYLFHSSSTLPPSFLELSTIIPLRSFLLCYWCRSPSGTNSKRRKYLDEERKQAFIKGP
jgi:hypothetical protein